VDLEVEAQGAQLFKGFLTLRARERLLHRVRLRRKQLIKVSKTKMIFSIVCPCADTADQGLKTKKK
jgi:hypothetical protein